jgi:hypothetical protein
MNTKQLQLVTFEQAKRLLALGFNRHEGKIFVFDRSENLPRRHEYAPAAALAIKWMRDEKGIICDVCYGENADEWIKYYPRIYHPDFLGEEYDTFEAAENALLDRLLTILEKEE